MSAQERVSKSAKMILDPRAHSKCSRAFVEAFMDDCANLRMEAMNRNSDLFHKMDFLHRRCETILRMIRQ